MIFGGDDDEDEASATSTFLAFETVDSIGRLQTATGELVLGQGGPVALPPFEQVLIGSDGTVTVQPQGQAPNNLAQVDRLLLVVQPARPELVGLRVEMTRILALAREFEIQLRLMQSAEENDQAATSLVSIS